MPPDKIYRGFYFETVFINPVSGNKIMTIRIRITRNGFKYCNGLNAITKRAKHYLLKLFLQIHNFLSA
jgi:hypothetical protein